MLRSLLANEASQSDYRRCDSGAALLEIGLLITLLLAVGLVSIQGTGQRVRDPLCNAAAAVMNDPYYSQFTGGGVFLGDTAEGCAYTNWKNENPGGFGGR